MILHIQTVGTLRMTAEAFQKKYIQYGTSMHVLYVRMHDPMPTLPVVVAQQT